MKVEKYSNEYMRLLTKKLHDHRLVTTCLTCVNFNPETEVCTLCQPVMRPPAKVIALGCPAWEGLPF